MLEALNISYNNVTEASKITPEESNLEKRIGKKNVN